MPCRREGNRSSCIALIVHDRVHWFIHLSLRKEVEHLLYDPLLDMVQFTFAQWNAVEFKENYYLKMLCGAYRLTGSSLLCSQICSSLLERWWANFISQFVYMTRTIIHRAVAVRRWFLYWRRVKVTVSTLFTCVVCCIFVVVCSLTSEQPVDRDRYWSSSLSLWSFVVLQLLLFGLVCLCWWFLSFATTWDFQPEPLADKIMSSWEKSP